MGWAVLTLQSLSRLPSWGSLFLDDGTETSYAAFPASQAFIQSSSAQISFLRDGGGSRIFFPIKGFLWSLLTWATLHPAIGMKQ